MSEPLGIDMPEFQLQESKRAYLREHGTLIEGVNDAGKKVYVTPLQPSTLVDEDGTIIYLGEGEVVRRNQGMCVIEQTPQWILRAIMQHAKGSYTRRDSAIWPETVWNVQHGIRDVFIMNKVDDEVMPLKLRKMLLNEGAPLISRFLIRENPEYGETHFIGIRRPAIKKADDIDAELCLSDSDLDTVGRKKARAACAFCLDDYLFPELREIAANAVTAPSEC